MKISYTRINTDVRYFSQGRLIDTRIRDLHTNLGETLIELKDLKSYVEDYIDMLQEFCEGNNKGAIGSCGTFESVDSFEIIVCKPVGHLWFSTKLKIAPVKEAWITELYFDALDNRQVYLYLSTLLCVKKCSKCWI